MSSSGNQEEGSQPSAEYIRLVVKGPDEAMVFYKIKRSTKVRTLVNLFNEKHDIHPEAKGFSFEYNGRHLEPTTQTLNELQMNDGDEIIASLIVPQYVSKESALSLQEKLMKQLEYTNAFIFENEEPNNSNAVA